MSYYFSKRVNGTFQPVVERVVAALKTEGFGVLSEIDVHSVMAQKLGVTMKPYKILGACNPPFAHKALELENKAGLMLPCNVVVQELEDGVVEVAAIDPVASMQAITNPSLGSVAAEVRAKLKSVVEGL